ncbi:hypothetical protein V7068_21640 [Bacillus sp. JJ634]
MLNAKEAAPKSHENGFGGSLLVLLNNHSPQIIHYFLPSSKGMLKAKMEESDKGNVLHRSYEQQNPAKEWSCPLDFC